MYLFIYGEARTLSNRIKQNIYIYPPPRSARRREWEFFIFRLSSFVVVVVVCVFNIGKVYYRSDRVKKPDTILKTKKITKNMGWCDDAYNKNYNKEIVLNKKNKGEKLFRKDNAYDVLIVIEYNTNKTKPFKGSAIFIHLTKNYGPTKGCIALKENDLLILLKIINKKSKIKIC